LPAEIGGTGSCLPELVVAKSRLNPTTAIPAGSTTIYTITVTNNGGGAEGVRVTDQLPSGFSFVSATVTYSTNAATAIPVNNLGSATVPVLGQFSIPGKTSITVQLTVNIPSTTSAGTYNNAAQVTYLDPTRTSANPNRIISPASFAIAGSNTTYESGGTVGGTNYNSALPNENVIIVPPSITIVKTVPQICMVVGSTAVYTISVTNQSTSAVSGISVNDIIPTGLNVTATTGNTASWSRSNTGNNNTFNYSGSLAAGASSSFTITVQAIPLQLLEEVVRLFYYMLHLILQQQQH
jgi:uncharacterized repeat protein (TIGR01451 family)